MNKLIFSNPINFYINNDCNLTCNNCATLSNYDYTGSYSYKNYAAHYEKWAELVHFPEIDLGGGEPFLHPELLTWATEIKKLWPDSGITVYSNGTLLGHEEKFKIAQELVDIGVGIHISCHSKKQFPAIEKYIKNLPSDLVRLVLLDKFFPTSIKNIENNVVNFRYGDRETSHSNCLFSTECYTLNQGLMFKCDMLTTYYNSETQFSYKDEDKKILDKYKPCSPFDDIKNIKVFINNLSHSVEQCSLCGFNNMSMNREDWVPITFEKRLKK